MTGRSIRRLVAGAGTVALACLGCAPMRPLRTAPERGMRVLVDLHPARTISMPSRTGDDLTRFERVSAIEGTIDQVNADTVWLSDVGVEHDEQWSWPHDAARLPVAGVGTSATLRARAREARDSLRRGRKIVVELYPARHIDVATQEGGIASYDGVVALDGHITRKSADTLWLRDVGVKRGDEWAWPHEQMALAVAGIGRTATVHGANSDLVTLGGIVVGSALVLGVLAVAALFIGLRSGT